MENNQRNSRKRLNSLILLVAFTAVMLIVSTYAWFSTQKNVTIGGLKGEVRVAEGLQISLDAQTWTNSINLDDFTVDTDTGVWTNSTYLPTAGATFQSPYVIGTDEDTGDAIYASNITPEQLLPVSTTAGTGEGVGEELINMYWGNLTEGVNLATIKKMDEVAASGYYAFDVFLQNASSGTDDDVLQLEPNSSVVVSTGKESTGLQNTVRVGFALYENNADDADSTNDAAVTVDGNVRTTEQIIQGTAVGKVIEDVAIWEPNADVHVETIVNTNNRIKWSADDLKAYRFDLDATAAAEFKFVGTPTYDDDGVTIKEGFVSQIPTYALTADSASTGTIANIYDWATPSAGLEKQITLQTPADLTNNDGMLGDDAIPLISIAKTEAEESDTNLTMEASQYHKVRIYVWLEGQDVDCTNHASLGGNVTLDIGFSKPGTQAAEPEPTPGG